MTFPQRESWPSLWRQEVEMAEREEETLMEGVVEKVEEEEEVGE